MKVHYECPANRDTDAAQVVIEISGPDAPQHLPCPLCGVEMTPTRLT